MQINRLFEIVYVLLGQKTVTASRLALQFGVSQRTIYRDIDTLSLAGIPVYAERGKGGGISLLPGFVLNKSILSEKEQQEILSALQALSSINTSETDNVFKKLSAFFNKSAADWLHVDFTGWGSGSGTLFDDFKTAILERRIVEFDYYSSHGEKTRRRFEPVQLWFKAKAWYVWGYCLKRRSPRVFKLTRVKNLRVLNKNFSVRSMPSALDNDGEDDRSPPVALKLRIDREMAYRVFDEFDEGMIEKQGDGSFIVSVTWPDTYWTYGFILSFGEYIEVLEPGRVRKNIKNILQKTGRKYL